MGLIQASDVGRMLEDPELMTEIAQAVVESPDALDTLARIHRWTGMDGVRAAEGGEGVTGAMIRGLEFG